MMSLGLPRDLSGIRFALNVFIAATIVWYAMERIADTNAIWAIASMVAASDPRVEEAARAKNCRADGVGLYRTEFLFLNAGRLPGEQEQFLAYRAVVEAMAPNPVIIRTLDLGGDKKEEPAPAKAVGWVASSSRLMALPLERPTSQGRVTPSAWKSSQASAASWAVR